MLVLFVLTQEENELLRSIFNKQRPMLHHIAFNLLGGGHDADDAMQEAFLRVMEHCEKTNGLPCPEMTPYCVIVVRNVCITMLRKRMASVPPPDIDEDMADGSMDTETEAERHIDNELLQRQLEKLPDGDRQLVQLHWVNELGYDKIGAIMGISGEAAKKRAQRILARLRKMLEREGFSR